MYQDSRDKRSDDELLAELFRLHRRVVLFWLLTQYHNYELAEDILQDAFMAILQRGDLQNVGCLRSYLFRVATNCLHERLAATRKEESRFVSDPETLSKALEVPGVPTLTCPYQQAFVNDLKACIERLPPRRRDVMILYVKGHEYQQIADTLGMSRDAVSEQIKKARKALEQALAFASHGKRKALQ